MLIINNPKEDLFDDENQTFVDVDPFTLELEHSLVSLSKWESKYQKPFLGSAEKTHEEILYYVWCMCLTPKTTFDQIKLLSQENVRLIGEYIESSQTATTFGKLPERKGPAEVITSELIYYWLIAFTIPFECERWHLNRLFALVQICNIKNDKPKKMSRNELALRNKQLNDERREKLKTSG